MAKKQDDILYFPEKKHTGGVCECSKQYYGDLKQTSSSALHQLFLSSSSALHQLFISSWSAFHQSSSSYFHQFFASTSPALHQLFISSSLALYELFISFLSVLRQLFISSSSALHYFFISSSFFNSSLSVLHSFCTVCTIWSLLILLSVLSYKRMWQTRPEPRAEGAKADITHDVFHNLSHLSNWMFRILPIYFVINLQGDPKKMSVSVLWLKSVIDVWFYFPACV